MPGDEARPPELIALGVAGLLESLRDDVREDIAALRDDVKEARALIVDFSTNHGQLHEIEASDRRDAHGTFYAFIRAQEVADARRDGALGVLRFTIELFSKHAPRLVAVILALAGALGVATGNVSVGIGQ